MIWYWMFFAGLPLVFLYWAYWLWKTWRELPELAGVVYEERIRSGELSKRVSRDDFVEAFTSVEGPRSSTHRFVAALASFLLLPVIIAVFNRIWDFFWRLGGLDPLWERLTLMHTMATFVFAMGCVIGIIYISVRRFYATQPPSLKAQLRTLEKANKS